jgi:hypothetical protein
MASLVFFQSGTELTGCRTIQYSRTVLWNRIILMRLRVKILIQL